jgi:L-alanine-DL-glutamate epimerase-like enolase superfamily enzyme
MLRRVALVRTDVSEKRQILQDPHGVTSQKTAFFIVTAVETLNLTFVNYTT